MAKNTLVKYGDIVVEIYPTTDGYGFECPLYGCKRTVDVRGDILHCQNRIYQHFHLEHKLEKQDVVEWTP
jgi:hypothetical protein